MHAAGTHHFTPIRVLRWLAYLLGFILLVLAIIIVAFALQARARLPDLRPWHTVQLQNEFRSDKASAPKTFSEYLALEEKLFAEVREEILNNPKTADTLHWGRYTPNTKAAQLAFDTIYNHSYELAPTSEVRGSVLLVHGLTDSPYAMRALAETFVKEGYYVVALRLPGHGTVPAGLLDVSWEDWLAAVKLAAQYTAEKSGANKPFIAGGFSTGAALVTLYSLHSLEDESLPTPQQLHLVSAAIGITPFASLTNIISSLSFIPGLEKSNWVDVSPEYDPYKYGSMPVNAAKQIYNLTVELQHSFDQFTLDQLAKMPQVHAYQSIVDSTVSSREVVRGLLNRLPENGHELIAFDLNRHADMDGLIAPGPLQDFETLKAATDMPFKITLITNRDRHSRAVAAYTREAHTSEVSVKDLDFIWPEGVFSVGHASLPFTIDDPVYGLSPPINEDDTYNIGALAVKGESGALIVGLSEFARLRCNPFFDVIRTNVVATLDP